MMFINIYPSKNKYINMQYRTLGKTGINASILGFGAMRLPQLDGNPEHVDINQTRKMIEYAVDKGVNIFDTAWLYHTSDRSKPGVSETVLGDILSTFDMDKLYISTKMPSWQITSWEYFDTVLDKHLERLKTDQIDLFHIHSIKDSFYNEIKDNGLYEFIDRALDDGRIKHACFSTHGSYEFLEQVLSDYDKWESVLTQLNYLDENDNTGLNGVKKLNSLNIGTMIMEPLRGGQLAVGQPSNVLDVINNAPGNYTPIEWAFNYLYDKSEINCVLSGMNNLEQVKYNIEVAEKSHIGMLTQEDKEIYPKLRAEYEKLKNIPCTSCNYCMPCPYGVNIPKCFKEYNMVKNTDKTINSIQYKYHMHQDRQAHNCTQCGSCITSCPQSINIPEKLKDVEEYFGM